MPSATSAFSVNETDLVNGSMTTRDFWPRMPSRMMTTSASSTTSRQ